MNHEEDELMRTIRRGKEPERLNIMSDIRKMAQTSMKKKSLTEADIRKTLGVRKYEKM